MRFRCSVHTNTLTYGAFSRVFDSRGNSFKTRPLPTRTHARTLACKSNKSTCWSGPFSFGMLCAQFRYIYAECGPSCVCVCIVHERTHAPQARMRFVRRIKSCVVCARGVRFVCYQFHFAITARLSNTQCAILLD